MKNFPRRRKKTRQRSQAPIYQLKITLRDSKPPIWRRVQLRGDTNLGTLHDIIQEVMGWMDYHLHGFQVGGRHYGRPSPMDWEPVTDERKVQLSQVAPVAGYRFIYTYDFGDDWEHIILVEKILPADPALCYPVCIKGRRACPPEDCGGVWGYEDLLKIIRNPKDKGYAEMLEWVGGEFDPADFGLEETNAALEKFR